MEPLWEADCYGPTSVLVVGGGREEVGSMAHPACAATRARGRLASRSGCPERTSPRTESSHDDDDPSMTASLLHLFENSFSHHEPPLFSNMTLITSNHPIQYPNTSPARISPSGLASMHANGHAGLSPPHPHSPPLSPCPQAACKHLLCYILKSIHDHLSYRSSSMADGQTCPMNCQFLANHVRRPFH